MSIYLEIHSLGKAEYQARQIRGGGLWPAQEGCQVASQGWFEMASLEWQWDENEDLQHGMGCKMTFSVLML